MTNDEWNTHKYKKIIITITIIIIKVQLSLNRAK